MGDRGGGDSRGCARRATLGDGRVGQPRDAAAGADGDDRRALLQSGDPSPARGANGGRGDGTRPIPVTRRLHRPRWLAASSDRWLGDVRFGSRPARCPATKRAGTPTTLARGDTSLVTTAHARTIRDGESPPWCRAPETAVFSPHAGRGFAD